MAGQHLIEDRAEAVHIGALVDLFVRDLLRRGMPWHGGHPEVDDLGDAIRRDEDVPCIQVAMQETARVRGFETARDLLGERPRFFLRETPPRRSIRSSSVDPSTSSRTRNGRPSTTP